MPPKARRGKQQRSDDDDDEVPVEPAAAVPARAEIQRKAHRVTKESGVAVKPAKDDDDEEWEDVDTSDEDFDENDVDERFDEGKEEVIQADDDEDDEDDDDPEYRELKKELRNAKIVRFADPKEVEAAKNEATGSKKRMELVTGKPAAVLDEETDEQVGNVFRPDLGDKLAPNQEYDFSNRAFDCFFRLKTEYPTLSFDIIRDNEGNGRTKYPITMYLVLGSEAPKANENHLCIVKVSNLLRTRHDGTGDESESEDDMFGANDSSDESGNDESDDDDGGKKHRKKSSTKKNRVNVDGAEDEVNHGEAVLHNQIIKHHGTVNRVRCNPNSPYMLASMSGESVVQVFDIESEARSLADFSNWSAEQAKAWEKSAAAGKKASAQTAVKFISGKDTHQVEGYGLDWSPLAPNVFASGDCYGQLFVWAPGEAGRWAPVGYTGTSPGRSVEEIQWSPTEANVLVACRAGGDVEVFDARQFPQPAVQWKADDTDINVATWNSAKLSSHLLATGSEEGRVVVWDLRYVKKKKDKAALQTLTYHEGSKISSIEFSEHNDTVLAVTADDRQFTSMGNSQCTLWDLSLERDAQEEEEVIGELYGRKDLMKIPDQLMWIHRGLCGPKEAHFHKQIPGMVLVSEYESIHMFKPRNWRSLMK